MKTVIINNGTRPLTIKGAETISITPEEIENIPVRTKNCKLIILNCGTLQPMVIDALNGTKATILARFTNGHEMLQCLNRNVTIWKDQADIEFTMKKIHGSPSGVNLLDNNTLTPDEIKDGVVFRSPKQIEQLQQIHSAIVTDSPVFITGPTGTGKTTIAKLIHEKSSRGNGPYFCINSNTLHSSTQDSELWGHRKGAYTGAAADKKGIFETHTDGTVFLDELADTPTEFQAQLLQMVQDKTLKRMGESKLTQVNTRIIAATNKNILQAIAENKFRSDLYYRLIGTHIKMLPLAECRENILPTIHLAIHNLNKTRKTTKEPLIQTILLEQQAYDFLLDEYEWPGNNRQLIMFIDHLVASFEDQFITYQEVEKILSKQAHQIEGVGPGVFFQITHPVTLEELKTQYINLVIEHTNTISDAAEVLGISERTLRRMIKQEQILAQEMLDEMDDALPKKKGPGRPKQPRPI